MKSQIILYFFILFNCMCIISPCIPEYNSSSKDLIYSNKTKINRTLIEIPSAKTCNITKDPLKEMIICYHGKCVSKLVPLNQTHEEKVVFCLCAEVKLIIIFLNVFIDNILYCQI